MFSDTSKLACLVPPSSLLSAQVTSSDNDYRAVKSGQLHPPLEYRICRSKGNCPQHRKTARPPGAIMAQTLREMPDTIVLRTTARLHTNNCCG